MAKRSTGLTDFPSEAIMADRRANWISLRTITRIRWLAVAGQVAAIVVASAVFELDFALGLCLAAIGLSAAINIASYAIFREDKLLTEREIASILLFDILQLCFLLYLTGGLHNPFSILLVAPVTISAATLSIRMTVFIAAVAIFLAATLTQYYVPLQTFAGLVLQVQEIFVIGSFAGIVIAVLFSAFYSQRVVSEMSSMGEALAATQMALAREQKLTDLGGVVAAAAHELGTPLATIKLVSGELIAELGDNPDMLEDISLIRAEADRCRDILKSMGRAGKSDLHMRNMPLLTVVEEAAEPHIGRGKVIEFQGNSVSQNYGGEPTISRRPEIVHGLRNLIQNAVDFADTKVTIEANWTKDSIAVTFIDDGPGFPSHLIGRLGSPFISSRKSDKPSERRPGYDGMGLGLFIAKTLLERTGAEVAFTNLTYETASHSGAMVSVAWPRSAIENKGATSTAKNPSMT